MTKPEKKQSFEENLAQLEKLLEKLEGGESTLEGALTHFEQGMNLVATCRSQLDTAEVTVEKIMARTDKAAGA